MNNQEKLSDAINRAKNTHIQHLLRTIQNESKIESLTQLIIYNLSNLTNQSEDSLFYKLNFLLEESIDSKMKTIDSLLDLMELE